MDTIVSNIRYSPDIGWLVINEWVFQNTYPKDVNFICSRSSGCNDYVAEWWHINNKYVLKWKPYHDYKLDTDGTLLKEVDTIHEVLIYCITHLHPDLL